jgi:hypothetical protein
MTTNSKKHVLKQQSENSSSNDWKMWENGNSKLRPWRESRQFVGDLSLFRLGFNLGFNALLATAAAKNNGFAQKKQLVIECVHCSVTANFA